MKEDSSNFNKVSKFLSPEDRPFRSTVLLTGPQYVARPLEEYSVKQPYLRQEHEALDQALSGAALDECAEAMTLSTPVSNSYLTEFFLQTLPIYRNDVSRYPYAIGFEIGLAHGGGLALPFYLLGPLSGTGQALAGSVLSAIGLLFLITVGSAFYTSSINVSPFSYPFKAGLRAADLQWKKYSVGILTGGLCAIFLYFILLV